MTRTRVVLAGAGKIGEAIVALLAPTGDYELTIVEQDDSKLEPFRKQGHATLACEVGEERAMEPVLAGHDAVISACPYYLTPHVAKAAKNAGVHYFDLTEDVASTRIVKDLAEGAATAVGPPRGHLARSLDDNVHRSQSRRHHREQG